MAALARDWITLWQSELTAMAADAETAETWARMAAIWAGMAASGIAAMPRGAGPHEPHFAAGAANPLAAFATPFTAPHATGAAEPARPAPAAAAPDAGGVAPKRGAERGVERLLQRVLDRLDGIEQRLAALEKRSGGGSGSADRRGTRPKRS